MEPNQSSGDARIEVNSDPDSASVAGAPQPTADRYWLHLLLFVLTLASTVYVGASWWANRLLHYEAHDQTISLFFLTLNQAWLVDGLRYAIPLVGFLTVHEFGHYFAARYHDVRTSLPYYIPFPFNGIGNFGAVISIRQRIPSTRSLFDIGVAGPLAGFVVALGALIYGFATLPPPEYLLDLPGHEALKAHIRQHGTFPDVRPTSGNGMPVLIVGYTPLYWALSQVFANVPPMYEMYHYPVLFAGWLGLFFTALNLLPVGQLDGGHVLYALLGDAWHRRFAQAFVFVLLFSGGIGFMDGMQQSLQDVSPWLGRASWLILAAIYYGYLYKIFGGTDRRTWAGLVGLLSGVGAAMALGWTGLGWTGWLVWSLLIIFLVRVKHPPVLRPQRLTPGRRILGYLAIAIFILCFSLQPLSTV
ncbi:site-2 protease family protein [Salinibacter ruber]|uniref:site-2 protease family protein n=1 Tax=Salinibacter ruber TaxID=146919 RepID=UPI00216A8128|nr:Zn-dependent protease [Salinibacter ruber]